MAPEVIQEKYYNGRADVWSLGISLIEMAEVNPPLMAQNPFQACLRPHSRPLGRCLENRLGDTASNCLDLNRGGGGFRGSQLQVGKFAFQIGRENSHTKSRVFRKIGTCGYAPPSLQSPKHHNISGGVCEIYHTKSRGFREIYHREFDLAPNPPPPPLHSREFWLPQDQATGGMSRAHRANCQRLLGRG